MIETTMDGKILPIVKAKFKKVICEFKLNNGETKRFESEQIDLDAPIISIGDVFDVLRKSDIMLIPQTCGIASFAVTSQILVIQEDGSYALQE